MKTPVAFIIFNRPDTCERVFEEIARARPSKLFVVADGPRPDHPDDKERCAAARAIIDRVDWDCEVQKNYSDINLGCGQRPATGISWVFEQAEEAIIIEDDCLPHPTFFRFCEEMLEKYRDDERVMTITGRNGLAGKLQETPYSYHFRRSFSCNGWATWRRAWQHYDFEIKRWPELRDTPWLMDVLGDQRAVGHWQKIFDRAYAAEGNVSYWDFQWAFASWVQHGVAAVAGVNLIRNIGFGADATHTKATDDDRAKWLTSEMVFPLRHPPHTAINREAELLIFDALPKERQQSSAAYVRRKLAAGLRRLLKPRVPSAADRAGR